MTGQIQTKSKMVHIGYGWRHVMCCWAFLGFFITYMLRVNLSVAIVAMVNQTAISNGSSVRRNESVTSAACIHSRRNMTSKEKAESFVEGSFVWDEKQQGAILSAFFYGYFLTQLPGGVIAGIVGPKWVYGLGLLITSVLTLFTPLAAHGGVGVLTALRFVEGLAEGVLFPVMHHLFGKWLPPLERSKLPAFTYGGCFIGTVVTFTVSGLLADSSWKWPSIFYISGGLGCIWFIGWAILVSDSPESHRWISPEECTYIQSSINAEKSIQQVKTKLSEVPWLSMVKSLPLYAICVSYFCHGFAFYVVLIYLPIYLRNILGFHIKQNGFLSSLPFLVAFIVQLCSSWVADFIRSKKWLNTTHVRKLFDISGNFCNGLCLILVTFAGCSRSVVLILLTMGTAIATFFMSGSGVNHLDLAPLYAGILLGVSNCLGNITGFLVPTIVGSITEENQTIEAWSKVFYLSAGIAWFSCIFYFVFASGNVQPWAKDTRYYSTKTGKAAVDTNNLKEHLMSSDV